MAPKINDEIREALHQRPGQPVEVEDGLSHLKYVLIPADKFERLRALFEDERGSDPRDAYPLVDQTFGGPEGWDAPGMEAYDDYDANRPKP